MTPQTVNAYYDAQMNDVNFPLACCNLRFMMARWMRLRAMATREAPSVMS